MQKQKQSLAEKLGFIPAVSYNDKCAFPGCYCQKQLWKKGMVYCPICEAVIALRSNYQGTSDKGGELIGRPGRSRDTKKFNKRRKEYGRQN